MSFFSAFDNQFVNIIDEHSGNSMSFDPHGGVGDFDLHGGVGHDNTPVAIWDGHGDTPAVIDNEGHMHYLSYNEVESGNIQDILSYSDPLLHASDYHCHHFELNNDHSSINLKNV